MTGWRDLPNELTAHILDILALETRGQGPGDLRKLASTMQVCRGFHAILKPIVYATPFLHFRSLSGRGTHGDCASDVYYSPLRRFTRTITSRPALGGLVKKLFVWSDEDLYRVVDEKVERCNARLSNEEAEVAYNSLPKFSQDDVRLLASIAVRMGLSNGLKLQGGCPGLLVLLLHHLPCLTALWADCDDEMTIVASAALGHIRGGIPVGLLSLTSLELRYRADYQELGISAEAVIPFMMLPALAKLQSWRIDAESCWGMICGDLHPPYSESQPSKEDGIDHCRHVHSGGLGLFATYPLPRTHYMQRRSSAVTHLEFIDSAIDGQALSSILELPRRLESFRYSIGKYTVGDAQFYPGSIREGLYTQRNSLTELFITCDDWSSSRYNEEPYADEYEPLGSLVDFVHLQHLQLPDTALLPSNDSDYPVVMAALNPLDSLLPPSLVTLVVDIRDENSLDEFLTVTGLPHTLYTTSQSLPELRMFGIVGINNRVGWGWADGSPANTYVWPRQRLWGAGHKIVLAALRTNNIDLSNLISTPKA